MRKPQKRIAALVIILCMIIALIPLSTVTVFAESTESRLVSSLMDLLDQNSPADTETDPSASPTETTDPVEEPQTSETPAPSETVTPSPSQELSNMPFTDVEMKEWYYDPVLWAFDHKITAGTSATTFSPESSCSRAEVMTFLWRANGSPKTIIRNNPFRDVSADDYFYDAILWAVSRGITSGTSENTFSPDKTCTRAQVMTFLWCAKNSPAPGVYSNNFTDVDKDEYYYEPVCWAVNNTITAGTSKTTFGPEENCTRAQVMTFLWQAYK